MSMLRSASTPTASSDAGGPLVQIALDVTTTEVAVDLAEAALAAGADRLEIGKPLVEFVGLTRSASIVAAFPQVWFELDLMIMAGATRYVRAAADMGAHGVTVTGLAPRRTIEDAVTAGREYDVLVTVDLFNVEDPVGAARTAVDLGAEALMVHVGVDQRRHESQFSQIAVLREIVGNTSVPVSYAAYDVTEAVAAVTAGASVVVMGDPLISADDPETALREFIREVGSARRGLTA
jgi:3-hexulose-6-phosphate synthase